MGNCTTKPKVMKDSDEASPPLEESTKHFPVTEAARRNDKGKEILISDDEQYAAKRPSLSHLFNEDKPRNLIQIENAEPEPVNQTGLSSSDASKPDQAVVSEIKVPQQMHQEIIKNQTDSSQHVANPEASSFLEVSEAKAPEPTKQEVLENQIDSSPEIAKPKASLLEVSEPIAPHPVKQEVLESQTGSLLEIPKLEDSVPRASEVMVPQETSSEVAKTEPLVPETSEVPKILEVPVEAKEASGTFAATHPQEQVFEDAQEKIEPEAILFDVAMATGKQDNKETVYAEASNDAENTVFMETEKDKNGVSLEKKVDETTNKLSELGTEEVIAENRVVTEKPEVTK